MEANTSFFTPFIKDRKYCNPGVEKIRKIYGEV